MPNPLVNVVIPVYNRCEAVRRAVESVLTQTYQPIEVIVVDDGSTDGTAEAVSAVRDSRVRLVRHETNRGGNAARNTGIRESGGPFVAFLDSDDEWLPTKLERQIPLFEKGGEKLGLVYSGVELTFQGGSRKPRIPRHYDDFYRTLLTSNVIGETSVAVVRRRAFEVAGVFDETLPSMQDLDLYLRICKHFTADFVPDTLVRICKQHGGGRISRDTAKALRGRELFCLKYRDEMFRHGVLHRFLRQIGWIELRGAANGRGARRIFRSAVRVKPFAPFTYVLLLAACLPVRWLDWLAHVEHRAIETLSGSEMERGVSGVVERL